MNAESVYRKRKVWIKRFCIANVCIAIIYQLIRMTCDKAFYFVRYLFKSYKTFDTHIMPYIFTMIHVAIISYIAFVVLTAICDHIILMAKIEENKKEADDKEAN